VLGRLNHVAIAVPNLDQAIEIYRRMFEATVGEPVDLPEHGVRLAFVHLENARIELLQPLGTSSAVGGFLAARPVGGLHHVCYEVDDLEQSCRALAEEGARILGDGQPRIGAEGSPVVVQHPKDFNGALIELMQASGDR
jgi:methylmalonyl-CoA/ethylmalonyl-CoA epimerase